MRLVEGGKHKAEKISFNGSPLSVVRAIDERLPCRGCEGLPRFYGGMVGYLSYDCVRFFERLPDKTTDDLKLPDICLALTKNLVVFDHRHHTIKVVSCVHLAAKGQPGSKN